MPFWDEQSVWHACYQNMPYQGKFLVQQNLDGGATIVVKLTVTHYRKSPLFSRRYSNSLCGSSFYACHMVLPSYQNMVDESYSQPKEEVIMGSFIEKNVGNIEQVKAKRGRPLKRQKNQKDVKIFKTFIKRDIETTRMVILLMLPVTICLNWDFLLNFYIFFFGHIQKVRPSWRGDGVLKKQTKTNRGKKVIKPICTFTL